MSEDNENHRKKKNIDRRGSVEKKFNEGYKRPTPEKGKRPSIKPDKNKEKK